jgi:ribonuclease HII
MTQAALLHVAGVDEAGRGPLAGPVVCAAVILRARARLPGLDDSKKLGHAAREALFPRIQAQALACCVVFIEVEEIDRLNIFQATMLGMRLALQGVAHAADLARIDGNHLPKDLPCAAEAWIDGDARDRSIMAASILAKVARDARMRELHALYPDYGFDRHKGYGCAAHLQALRTHGPCPQHRRSFAPVRDALFRPQQALLPGLEPAA